MRIQKIKLSELGFKFCAFAVFATTLPFRATPPLIDQLNNPDPGFFWLMKGVVRLLRIAGAMGPVPASALTQLVGYALILCCAALFLLARVPRSVYVGALAALTGVVWIFGLPFGQHTVEALVAVVVCVHLAAVHSGSGARSELCISAAFGLAAGYLRLIRQSSSGMIYLPVACGLLLGLAVLAFARVRRSEIALRHLGPLLIFGVGAFLASNVPQWVIAATTSASSSEHGVGAPLYAGLGFAANPYNIAWDDDVVALHLELLTGRSISLGLKDQGSMTRAALEIVRRDPGLFARNAIAKAVYVLRFFAMRQDPGLLAADQLVLQPSAALSLAMLAAVLAWIFALWRCRKLSVDGFLFAGEMTAVVLAALAVMILVAPFYFSGLISGVMMLLGVGCPSLLDEARRPRPSVAERTAVRRAAAIAAGALAAFLVAAASMILWRDRVNSALSRQLLDGEPQAQLDALGVDYVYRFNRLPEPEQRQVLGRILAARLSDLQKPEKTIVAGPFEPAVVFVHGALLYAVGRFDPTWRMTLPSRVQGPRNSVLVLWPRGIARAAVLKYDDHEMIYQKLPDANWDGRYHMFAFPAVRLRGRPLAAIGVYNFTGGTHMGGLTVEPVSEARLEGPGVLSGH